MKMLTTAIVLAFSMVAVNASAKSISKESRAKLIKAAQEHMEKTRGQHGNKG